MELSISSIETKFPTAPIDLLMLTNSLSILELPKLSIKSYFNHLNPFCLLRLNKRNN